MSSFTLPADYPRLQVVRSFHELVTMRFAGGVNALCWPRTLAGDFGEVVARLGAGEGIVTLDEERLRALPQQAPAPHSSSPAARHSARSPPAPSESPPVREPVEATAPRAGAVRSLPSAAAAPQRNLSATVCRMT